DEIAGEKVGHIGPDVHDPADELVADRHGNGDGFLRPHVPLVDMDVGAADPGPQHLDEDVVDADRGCLDIFQPQAGLAPALYQCFHIDHDSAVRLETCRRGAGAGDSVGGYARATVPAPRGAATFGPFG